VLENLEVGRQAPRHWPDGSAAPCWTPQALFQLFPNLGEMPDRLGGRMSGGEQQMLTVARSLMSNPFLVLLDEPGAGVNPALLDQIVDKVAALNRQGTSFLIIEHNMDLVMSLCRPVMVMAHGRLLVSGEPAEVLRDPRVVEAYLGDAA